MLTRAVTFGKYLLTFSIENHNVWAYWNILFYLEELHININCSLDIHNRSNSEKLGKSECKDIAIATYIYSIVHFYTIQSLFILLLCICIVCSYTTN